MFTSVSEFESNTYLTQKEKALAPVNTEGRRSLTWFGPTRTRNSSRSGQGSQNSYYMNELDKSDSVTFFVAEKTTKPLRLCEVWEALIKTCHACTELNTSNWSTTMVMVICRPRINSKQKNRKSCKKKPWKFNCFIPMSASGRIFAAQIHLQNQFNLWMSNLNGGYLRM